MRIRRLNQLQAILPKAVAPGSVVSCLLLVAWFLGWSPAFSPQGFVLLTLAWLGGVAWAFMPEYERQLDSDVAHHSAEYRAELHSLAVSLDRQLAEEITSARTEVQRTGIILREAVEGLNLSFRKLGAHAQRLQEGMTVALQEDVGLSASLPERVDQDVGQAVRCLQFEDIATQSLSTADHHLLQLNQLTTLMQRALSLASRPDPQQLKHLKAEIEELVAARDNADPKVLQDSMSGGDVELF